MRVAGKEGAEGKSDIYATSTGPPLPLQARGKHKVYNRMLSTLKRKYKKNKKVA